MIVTPPAVAGTRNGAAGEVETISNGKRETYLGIGVEAVPTYSVVFGLAPGKPFHHKGIGNGYVLRFGETRVYFSVDTVCLPEMKVQRNIVVAFVAANPPRTMPQAEAAAYVREFCPKIVFAYHYGGQNTQEVAHALKNTGIEVRLRKLEDEPQALKKEPWYDSPSLSGCRDRGDIDLGPVVELSHSRDAAHC